MPNPAEGMVTGSAIAVLVDNVALACTGGSVDRQVAVLKANSSKTGCYQLVKGGLKSAKASLTCVYDSSDLPPDIQEGDFVTLVVDTAGGLCEPTSAVGRVITIPCLVASVKDTWQNAQDYNYSLELESSGEYTTVEPA
jgi:hypothetical protein